MANEITYELDGEIALIGLNRPDKRNCMNAAMNQEFAKAVARAQEEAKVRRPVWPWRAFQRRTGPGRGHDTGSTLHRKSG